MPYQYKDETILLIPMALCDVDYKCCLAGVLIKACI